MIQKLASVFFAGCLVLTAGCSDTKSVANPPASRNEIASLPIVYRPPQRDAPVSRIARIPRGASTQLPHIAVLVPEQVAYTAQEQPLLFWFSSKPTDVKCRISLHDVGKTPHQVIFETSLDGIGKGGIQKLDLVQENVRLRPGATYQWLIALVPNPAAPSNNVAAGGLLQRMTPSGELSAKLAGKSAAEQAREYAAAGFWFDALSTLAGAIDASPADESLRQMRSSLLMQANLTEPAESDVGG